MAEEPYKRDNDKLYVNTTLYDYYSDYELNGYNRDNYQATSIYTDRIYQPFRQLDQALSYYYYSNGAIDPLYTGNFQNYDDGSTHFRRLPTHLTYLDIIIQISFIMRIIQCGALMEKSLKPAKVLHRDW